jgi:hypothetical protein
MCRKEGKDDLHDWKLCQKRRRAEAAGAAEATVTEIPTGDRNRSVATLSILRIDPIRLEGEEKRVKDVRLTLDIVLTFAPGVTRKVRALVDTGAEVNLLRRGIASPEYLTPVKRPLKLATASREPLPGGDREVRCMATMMGREIDSGEERTIEVPVDFYEAAIGVDAIIGYEWLAAYEFWVNAGRNSITRQFPDTGNNVSISGNREKRREIAMATRIETPIVLPYDRLRQATEPTEKTLILRTPRTFRMLDLFSGTGSVGAYFRRLGYEVVLVDSNPKWEPDIIADIGTWEFWKFFQRGDFDVVGCCPPLHRIFPSDDRTSTGFAVRRPVGQSRSVHNRLSTAPVLVSGKPRPGGTPEPRLHAGNPLH